MIVKSVLSSIKRITHLYIPLFASCVMLVMVANPVQADALLGVISYHIVPTQLQNSEEQQEEQEEEESSVEDGKTTVAQNEVQTRNSDISSVSKSVYPNQEYQTIPM